MVRSVPKTWFAPFSIDSVRHSSRPRDLSVRISTAIQRQQGPQAAAEKEIRSPLRGTDFCHPDAAARLFAPESERRKKRSPSHSGEDRFLARVDKKDAELFFYIFLNKFCPRSFSAVIGMVIFVTFLPITANGIRI